MASIDELPNHLLIEVFLRIPYTFHSILTQVCKAWRDIVKNEKFYDCRMEFGLSEKYICVLHEEGIEMYDPLRCSWHRLPPIPSHIKPKTCLHCVCWGRKLVLIGLKDDCAFTTGTLLIFDLQISCWYLSNEMPQIDLSPRISFCVSPQGIVYVAGSYTRNAAAYNIVRNQWELLPRMALATLSATAFTVGEVLYIVNLDGEAQRYDPNRRVWIRIDNIEGDIHGYNWQTLYAFGRLFVFRNTAIVENDMGSRNSRIVEQFSEIRIVVSATAWCDQIFWATALTPSPQFYMLQPSETTTATSTAIDVPTEFGRSIVKSVTTLEI